jgi:hypothetical protein
MLIPTNFVWNEPKLQNIKMQIFGFLTPKI